jgi:hypothetical protein
MSVPGADATHGVAEVRTTTDRELRALKGRSPDERAQFQLARFPAVNSSLKCRQSQTAGIREVGRTTSHVAPASAVRVRGSPPRRRPANFGL